MDTIASGAVKYISTLTDVTALLGSFPSTSPHNAGKPFIFNTDIVGSMEGTGAVALVLNDAGTYSVAPPLQTPLHFRLQITFWVDPARDSANNIIESAGKTIARGKHVWQVLNTHLHRTTGDAQMWGDLRAATSQLLAGPQFFGATDVGQARVAITGTTSRPQIGVAYYGVGVFGYSDVVS
jgi:hypothetical protein